MIATPPEDEPTFEGNAAAKAVYYSRFAPGEWVLADDSGLEVDALGGLPGVRSARFSEDMGSFDPALGPDRSNNRALLASLAGHADRRARYRCALAIARDGQVHHTAFGSVEGEILEAPQGDGGFGYDPLFLLPEVACTMAQISTEQRMLFSHRTRALRKLLESGTLV